MIVKGNASQFAANRCTFSVLPKTKGGFLAVSHNEKSVFLTKAKDAFFPCKIYKKHA